MGFPAQGQGQIGMRLFRGGQSLSGRGLGLGLSPVKIVVQAHRGNLAVMSKCGPGAEFTLSWLNNPIETDLDTLAWRYRSAAGSIREQSRDFTHDIAILLTSKNH